MEYDKLLSSAHNINPITPTCGMTTDESTLTSPPTLKTSSTISSLTGATTTTTEKCPLFLWQNLELNAKTAEETFEDATGSNNEGNQNKNDQLLYDKVMEWMVEIFPPLLT